jgi:hypothetical protein
MSVGRTTDNRVEGQSCSHLDEEHMHSYSGACGGHWQLPTVWDANTLWVALQEEG